MQAQRFAIPPELYEVLEAMPVLPFSLEKAHYIVVDPQQSLMEPTPDAPTREAESSRRNQSYALYANLQSQIDFAFEAPKATPARNNVLQLPAPPPVRTETSAEEKRQRSPIQHRHKYPSSLLRPALDWRDRLEGLSPRARLIAQTIAAVLPHRREETSQDICRMVNQVTGIQRAGISLIVSTLLDKGVLEMTAVRTTAEEREYRRRTRPYFPEPAS